MHDIRHGGNNCAMDLRDSAIKGIVEVMDDSHTREREQSLTSALARLSQAREQRGAVGVIDPFEAMPVDERFLPEETSEQPQRRRLFGFALRARRASDAYGVDAE